MLLHDQPEFIICVYKSEEDRYVSNSILKHGTWELGISIIIKLLLEQSDQNILFLDVGANLGIHSLYAASLGYRVVAIEPQEKNLIKVSIYFHKTVTPSLEMFIETV